MLARLELKSTDELGIRVRTIFPVWHALLVEPNREQRSAEWLKKVGMHVYLPTYIKQQRVHRSARKQRAVLRATIPGMMFIPVEMLTVDRRDEKLEWAHVYGFIKGSDGLPSRISKSDIELIRLMEAKLNAPPDSFVDGKGKIIKVGDEAEFVNPLYALNWGKATVCEVASENRIGIEVAGLFGRSTRTFVPASEIVVM